MFTRRIVSLRVAQMSLGYRDGPVVLVTVLCKGKSGIHERQADAIKFFNIKRKVDIE